IWIVLFRLFAKLNGKCYWEALVHVVAESDLRTEFFAKRPEQFQGFARLHLRIENGAFVQSLQVGRLPLCSPADMNESGSFGHELTTVVDNRRRLGAARMTVDLRRFAALAANQLINRHTRLTPLDIPQGLVDSVDGVVQNRTVFPVRTVITGLPDVLYAIRGFSEQER